MNRVLLECFSGSGIVLFIIDAGAFDFGRLLRCFDRAFELLQERTPTRWFFVTSAGEEKELMSQAHDGCLHPPSAPRDRMVDAITQPQTAPSRQLKKAPPVPRPGNERHPPHHHRHRFRVAATASPPASGGRVSALATLDVQLDSFTHRDTNRLPVSKSLGPRSSSSSHDQNLSKSAIETNLFTALPWPTMITRVSPRIKCLEDAGSVRGRTK